MAVGSQTTPNWTRPMLLTLWGELFALTNSTVRDVILPRYPAPGGTLLAGDAALLVLTSSQRLHHVHAELTTPPTHVLVLTVVHDISAKALRVGDLMRGLADRVRDRGGLTAALRRRGIVSRLGASDLPFVPASQPLMYDWSAVPRIGRADSGVTDVDYDAALDADRALEGSALDRVAAVYGLEHLVHD